jgi:putative methyltransferase (TIGR04325 family)
MSKFRFLRNTKEILNYDSPELIEWIYSCYQKFLFELDLKEISTEPFVKFNEIFENSLPNQSFNIIDIGGGGGLLYFITKKNYPQLNFNWIVVETKLMVQSLQSFQNSELFFTTLDNLQNFNLKHSIDLIVLNSSLQYFVNPRAILQLILSLQSRFIYFGKTPLCLKSSLNGVQLSKKTSHGPRFKDFEVLEKDNQVVLNRISILEYREFFDFFKLTHKILFLEIEGKFVFSHLIFFKILFESKSLNTFNILLQINPR